MKKLIVEVEGEDWSDLELALEEVQGKVSEEYREGFDRNDSGRYHFRVTEVDLTDSLTDAEGRCEHGQFLTGGTGVCPMPREQHRPVYEWRRDG